MATLKQLQDKGDVPPPPHKLTEAEKSEWAQSGRPFAVQSVALKSAEGGRTYWDVLAESNGDVITFGLSSHAERDGLMQALANHTLSEPVEGIRLRVLDVKRNTEFIGLDAAEEG